ncbi:hypothetical protein H9L13_10305 [Sphingomonas lutea]|uniref:Uncharacterized protein n=1 Tax=Sphingomonas lutea TaxID=1045317 RepID=A0A7G9SGP4_9SPHN|nr:hypothetical protein [Sphingomonas lutea]QNN67019.1 hypothetical protein H9L13_10305 [Sphingomonas lutea]
MRRDRSEEAAAARAHWLAELAEALRQAQDLAWQLGPSVGNGAERMDLYGRIEALLGEVRSLQLRPAEAPPQENAPQWTSKSPWCSPDRDHTP